MKFIDGVPQFENQEIGYTEVTVNRELREAYAYRTCSQCKYFEPLMNKESDSIGDRTCCNKLYFYDVPEKFHCAAWEAK